MDNLLLLSFVLVLSLIIIGTYSATFATLGTTAKNGSSSLFSKTKTKYGVFTKCHSFCGTKYFYEPASGAWLAECYLTKEERLQASTLIVRKVNEYPS